MADPPELHVKIMGFSLTAKGRNAIAAVRWPLALVLLSVPVVVLVAVQKLSLGPAFGWARSLLGW